MIGDAGGVGCDAERGLLGYENSLGVLGGRGPAGLLGDCVSIELIDDSDGLFGSGTAVGLMGRDGFLGCGAAMGLFIGRGGLLNCGTAIGLGGCRALSASMRSLSALR